MTFTKDEQRVYSRYIDSLYPYILRKYPHSEWCELETGFWHDCDCGASNDRDKALAKILQVWLKRRGHLPK
jgi:hypothetical protein